MATSQARTTISLHFNSSIISKLICQKHQHQYFPYLVGCSGCFRSHSIHVFPSSTDASTLITLRPPPAGPTPINYIIIKVQTPSLREILQWTCYGRVFCIFKRFSTKDGDSAYRCKHSP